MNHGTHSEAMFPARLSAWRSAREFLERFCTNASVNRLPSLRLNLILEELFTNSINHGHRGDCDSHIWIGLAAGISETFVVYTDDAPPFNPLAMAAAQLAVPLDEREIGGLGVHLTIELTSASDYVYLFGRNRLRLAVPK